MLKQLVYGTERCTDKVAAAILHLSLSSAKNYLTRLRKVKGIQARGFVSVGEFVEYYRLNVPKEKEQYIIYL